MQNAMLFRAWRFISVRLRRSHGSLLQCDFYVYTCGQVQAHQSVDGFIRWIDDVHETLMSTHLELVARRFIDVRRTQHVVTTDTGRQRYWTTNYGARTFRSLDAFGCRLIDQLIVDCFQADGAFLVFHGNSYRPN